MTSYHSSIQPSMKAVLLHPPATNAIISTSTIATIKVTNTTPVSSKWPEKTKLFIKSFAFSGANTNSTVSVDFFADTNSQVKGGALCVNKSYHAVLWPGQSCQQPVFIRAASKTIVSGDVIIQGTSAIMPLEEKIPVSTNFDSRDNFTVSNSLESGAPVLFRPNGWASIIINNTSTAPSTHSSEESVINNTYVDTSTTPAIHSSEEDVINGAYVDLSKIPDSLIPSKGIQTPGTIYDADKKILTIPEIRPKETTVIKFLVPGASYTNLSDSSIATSLENNATTKRLKLGASNVPKDVLPDVETNPYPFDFEQKTPESPIVISNPVTSASLYFSDIEIPDLPKDTVVTTTVKPGTELKPGESMIFDVTKAPDAPKGVVFFTAKFRDSSNTVFKRDMSISIDNTTTIKTVSDLPIIFRKHEDSTRNRSNPVEIKNTGKFNITLPEKLSDQFSVSGGGLVVDAPDNKFNGGISCAGLKLSPGKSCYINILSQHDNTDLHHYPLNILDKADQNLDPETGFAMLDLQDSPLNPEISVTKALPGIINENLFGTIEITIKNKGEALKITKLAKSYDGGLWNCEGIKEGDTINAGTDSAPDVVFYRCRTTGTANTRTSGKINMEFNEGDISYESPVFEGLFKAENDLPANITVSDSLAIGPGSVIKINIVNQSLTSRAQDVKIHLAEQDAYKILRKGFTVPTQTGIDYNPETGIITLLSDIPENSTRSVVINFPLSPNNITLLENNKDALLANTQSHIIKITSNGNKPYSPVVNVNNTILSYSPSTITFASPEELHNLKVTNNTSTSLNYHLSSPAGVIASTSEGTIASGVNTTIAFKIEDKKAASGQNKITINITDPDSNNYTESFPIEITSPSLEIQGENTVYLPGSGHTNTSNITLVNKNVSDKGFSIYGMEQPGNVFSIMDGNNKIIDSNLVEITRDTYGNSFKSEILYGEQFTIGITITGSLSTNPPPYTLINKKTGNLLSRATGTLLFVNSYPFISETPIATIPAKVLPDTVFEYKSLIKNISGKELRVLKVSETAQNTSLPYQVVFDNSQVNPEKNLWDGSTGANLQDQQDAYLDFTSQIPDGKTFDYNLEMTLQSGHVVQTIKMKKFNTQTSSGIHDLLNAIDDTPPVEIKPSEDSTFRITAPVEGLNNFYLDLTSMPNTLFAQIDTVRLQEKGVTVPLTQGKIMLGSLLAGKNESVIIKMKNTAKDALLEHFSAVNNNAVSHCIAFGATNSLETYPALKAIVTPLTSPAIPEINSTGTKTITFINHANAAMTIKIPTTNFPDGITIQDNQCSGKVLNHNTPCEIKLNVSSNAYFGQDYSVTLPYEDATSKKYTTIVNLIVSGVTASISSNAVLHRPASGTQDYPVTLTNNGPFTLRTVTGTLFDLLTISPLAKSRLKNNASPPNKPCTNALVKGDVCTFFLEVFSTDTPGYVTIGLPATPTQFNLKNNTDAQLQILGTKGAIGVFDSSNVTPVSKVDIKASATSSSVLTIRNTGETAMNKPIPSFSWNTTSPEPAPTFSFDAGCGSTIASGSSCPLTVTGAGRTSGTGGIMQGTLTLFSENAEPDTVTITVNVAPNFQPTSVSTGGNHTCAISNGELYCWGRNAAGELGIGETGGYKTTPQKIDLNNISSVSAGTGYTCAINTGGELYCWGSNFSGELGLSPKGGTKNVPQKVAIANVTYVSAGTGTTCAINSVKQLYCWGDNGLGQTANSSVSTPVNLNNVTEVTTSGSFTCAISDNRPYCWGYNLQGELGRGITGATTDPFNPSSGPSLINSNTPELAHTPTNNTKMIASGGSHACAVVMESSSKLYCWGGSGSSLPEPTPFPVNTGNYIKVALGSISLLAAIPDTCFINTGKELYCWNYDPTKANNNPQKINPGNVSDVTDVSVSSDHMCAISNGKLYCWGDNSSGQLGTNNTTASTVPVQVHDPG